jgi:hypothetical protein
MVRDTTIYNGLGQKLSWFSVRIQQEKEFKATPLEFWNLFT